MSPNEFQRWQGRAWQARDARVMYEAASSIKTGKPLPLDWIRRPPRRWGRASALWLTGAGLMLLAVREVLK